MAEFIRQDPAKNHVIYVGFNPNEQMKTFTSLSKAGLKDNFIGITLSHRAQDCEYYLAPLQAIKLAQQLEEEKNVLFVLDNTLDQHFKESHIFNLAS
jgi:F0F1-type ATP synthase alpha subunit